MDTEAHTASALLAQLSSAISGLPGGLVHAEQTAPDDRADSRIDAVVDVSIGCVPIRLVIEMKQGGFPRDVREAVWQLRNYLAHLDSGEAQVVPMVVVPALSPGARQFLRDEQIGYFDGGGSLFVPARGSWIFVDRPPPRAGQRKADALFSGRRALVLLALWEHREEWVGVNQLAQTAMVSPATASETLSALERREWVEAKGSGPTKERRLIDARALLDAWTDHQKQAKPPPMRRYFVPASGMERLIDWTVHAFEHGKMEYMVTGEAAAQIYAPYLSTVNQLRCRIHETAHAIVQIDELGAREVKEGWNLGIVFTQAPGDFAFRQLERGVWLASPLQTYLDLLLGAGRSAEMAEHLREQRLGA